MSAFAEARSRAERVPRRFVDWDEWFSSDEPEQHRLYLGAMHTAWDVCCGRQICDRMHWPTPRLAVIGPYMRIIRKLAVTSNGAGERRCLQHAHLLSRRPPLYFDRIVEGELAYVDLDAAYWSIYTRATLDVDYDGERSPRLGTVTFRDALALGEDKLVRNALLGSLRRSRRRGIDHGVPFIENVPAIRQRPNLWGLVMDCLELWAWRMRQLGAVYVHTDGAIFPHLDLAEDAVDVSRETFHLRAKIEAAGDGVVMGLGRWKIGDTNHGISIPRRRVEPGQRVDSMVEPPAALAASLRILLQHDIIPA